MRLNDTALSRVLSKKRLRTLKKRAYISMTKTKIIKAQTAALYSRGTLTAWRMPGSFSYPKL